MYYNAHRYKNARYGEIEAIVTVDALTGLAPNVLVDAANAFDGNPLDAVTKRSFKDWNVVGFEGGGSTIEFTTSELAVRDLCRPLSFAMGGIRLCMRVRR